MPEIKETRWVNPRWWNWVKYETVELDVETTKCTKKIVWVCIRVVGDREKRVIVEHYVGT